MKYQQSVPSFKLQSRFLAATFLLMRKHVNIHTAPPFLSNMTIVVQTDQIRKQDSNSAGHRAHHGVAERRIQTNLLSADCGLM